MHKVFQLYTGYPFGQCTEASIASVFEIPLDEVPVLADRTKPKDAPLDSIRTPERWFELMKWINARGRYWCEFALHKKTVSFIEDLRTVLWDTDGFSKNGIPIFDMDSFEHLILGKVAGSGGIGHAIVGKHGYPIWDPNPYAGESEIMYGGVPHLLFQFDAYVFFPPLAQLPEKYHTPEIGTGITVEFVIRNG